MPFSSGTYTAPVSSWNPAVAATDIDVTDWAALLSDISTALSTAICKDGQTTTTGLITFAQGANVSLATDASSTTTGALKTAGGLGVSKQLWADKITEVTGLAWSTYTPTISADTGSWGALTIVVNNYRILGKNLFLGLNLNSPVASGSPTEARILLPASKTGKDTRYIAVLVGNNSVNEIGMAVQSTNTYLSFQRVTGAAWTGTCYFHCNLVLEIA